MPYGVRPRPGRSPRRATRLPRAAASSGESTWNLPSTTPSLRNRSRTRPLVSMIANVARQQSGRSARLDPARDWQRTVDCSAGHGVAGLDQPKAPAVSANFVCRSVPSATEELQHAPRCCREYGEQIAFCVCCRPARARRSARPATRSTAGTHETRSRFAACGTSAASRSDR